MSSITFFPASSGGSSPANGDLVVGGVYLKKAGLITLYNIVSGSLYGSYREQDGSAGYTPSGANNFRVYAVKYIAITASPTSTIFYTSNDLGILGSSALTGQTFIGGVADLSRFEQGGFIATAPNAAVQETALDFVVPNGNYLGLSTVAATVVYSIVYGYEEA